MEVSGVSYLDSPSWGALVDGPQEASDPRGVPVPPEGVEAPQDPTYGLPEEVLAALELTPCIKCGRTIGRKWPMRRLPKEVRRRMRYDGIVTTAGRGLCAVCHKAVNEVGGLDEYPKDLRNQVPLHERFPLAEMWEETTASGGHLPELAKRLDVTPEGLRCALKRIHIHPDRKVRTDSQERDHLIEEVEFLVSCGVGVHEIAQKFNLTDHVLIERFRDLRADGFTAIDLQYRDVTERNREKAA